MAPCSVGPLLRRLPAIRQPAEAAKSAVATRVAGPGVEGRQPPLGRGVVRLRRPQHPGRGTIRRPSSSPGGTSRQALTAAVVG